MVGLDALARRVASATVAEFDRLPFNSTMDLVNSLRWLRRQGLPANKSLVDEVEHKTLRHVSRASNVIQKVALLERVEHYAVRSDQYFEIAKELMDLRNPSSELVSCTAKASIALCLFERNDPGASSALEDAITSASALVYDPPSRENVSKGTDFFHMVLKAPLPDGMPHLMEALRSQFHRWLVASSSIEEPMRRILLMVQCINTLHLDRSSAVVDALVAEVTTALSSKVRTGTVTQDESQVAFQALKGSERVLRQANASRDIYLRFLGAVVVLLQTAVFAPRTIPTLRARGFCLASNLLNSPHRPSQPWDGKLSGGGGSVNDLADLFSRSLLRVFTYAADRTKDWSSIGELFPAIVGCPASAVQQEYLTALTVHRSVACRSIFLRAKSFKSVGHALQAAVPHRQRGDLQSDLQRDVCGAFILSLATSLTAALETDAADRGVTVSDDPQSSADPLESRSAHRAAPHGAEVNVDAVAQFLDFTATLLLHRAHIQYPQLSQVQAVLCQSDTIARVLRVTDSAPSVVLSYLFLCSHEAASPAQQLAATLKVLETARGTGIPATTAAPSQVSVGGTAAINLLYAIQALDAVLQTTKNGGGGGDLRNLDFFAKLLSQPHQVSFTMDTDDRHFVSDAFRLVKSTNFVLENLSNHYAKSRNARRIAEQLCLWMLTVSPRIREGVKKRVESEDRCVILLASVGRLLGTILMKAPPRTNQQPLAKALEEVLSVLLPAFRSQRSFERGMPPRNAVKQLLNESKHVLSLLRASLTRRGIEQVELDVGRETRRVMPLVEKAVEAYTALVALGPSASGISPTSDPVLTYMAVDVVMLLTQHHQRSVRLLSSTNILALKPVVRLLTPDMLSAFVQSVTREAIPPSSSDAADVSSRELGPESGSSSSSLSSAGLHSSIRAALRALELSPHIGFSASDREALLTFLVQHREVIQSFKSFRFSLEYIVGRGEILYA